MTDEVDIAILTVIPEEYKAVCSELNAKVLDSGSHYEPNIYQWRHGFVGQPVTGNKYHIIVGMIGRPTSAPASQAITATIERFKPRYVLLVGIAGGFHRENLKKGDVVFSEVIYGYQYGALKKKFEPRPNFVYQIDTGLLNSAQAVGEINQEWNKRLGQAPVPGNKPKSIRGPIASGEMVLDDLSNEFFKPVLKLWPRLQAVEMEGTGAAAAIETARAKGINVGFMMIRGISDMPPSAGTNRDKPQLAEEQQSLERKEWTRYASKAAARFTRYMISTSWPLSPRGDVTLHESISASARIEPALEAVGNRNSLLNQNVQNDTFIGLYYPYIHFRDVNWLKAAALYWDKVGRIVPRSYDIRDGIIVKALRERLDFVVDFRPEGDAGAIGGEFMRVIEEHKERLSERYAVEAMRKHGYRSNIEDRQRGFSHGVASGRHIITDVVPENMRMGTSSISVRRSFSNANVAIINVAKIDEELLNSLINTGLAELSVDDEWAIMHPKLGAVYMTALAAKMAASRMLHPLAAASGDHVAVSMTSIEGIARQLLGKRAIPEFPITQAEIVNELVNISIRCIRPANGFDIDIPKIIDLRRRYSDEFRAFQLYIRKLVEDIEWIRRIEDWNAVQAHLNIVAEKQISPLLREIERIFSESNIPVVDDAMNIRYKVSKQLYNYDIDEERVRILIDKTSTVALSGGIQINQSSSGILPNLQHKTSAFLLKTREAMTPESMNNELSI